MKDAISLEIISDATVTAKLLDPEDDDETVSGSSFSLPVTNSQRGNYGAASAEIDLDVGKVYTLDIQGVKNGARIYHDQIPVLAGYGDGS